jgi:hypothetical protein
MEDPPHGTFPNPSPLRDACNNQWRVADKHPGLALAVCNVRHRVGSGPPLLLLTPSDPTLSRLA